MDILTTTKMKNATYIQHNVFQVRTKIIIDNKIMEQVNSFNLLGNMISYEKELDINNKLH